MHHSLVWAQYSHPRILSGVVVRAIFVWHPAAQTISNHLSTLKAFLAAATSNADEFMNTTTTPLYLHIWDILKLQQTQELWWWTRWYKIAYLEISILHQWSAPSWQIWSSSVTKVFCINLKFLNPSRILRIRMKREEGWTNQLPRLKPSSTALSSSKNTSSIHATGKDHKVLGEGVGLLKQTPTPHSQEERLASRTFVQIYK